MQQGGQTGQSSFLASLFPMDSSLPAMSAWDNDGLPVMSSMSTIHSHATRNVLPETLSPSLPRPTNQPQPTMQSQPTQQGTPGVSLTPESFFNMFRNLPQHTLPPLPGMPTRPSPPPPLRDGPVPAAAQYPVSVYAPMERSQNHAMPPAQAPTNMPGSGGMQQSIQLSQLFAAQQRAPNMPMPRMPQMPQITQPSQMPHGMFQTHPMAPQSNGAQRQSMNPHPGSPMQLEQLFGSVNGTATPLPPMPTNVRRAEELEHR